MILGLVLTAAAGTAAPQSAPPFTPEQMQYIQRETQRLDRLRSLTSDQALILYDQCLSREAVAMSRTSAADDAIFGLAYARCVPLRLDLLSGRPPEWFMKFKALDDAKRAASPELTKKIRERREVFDAQVGKSSNAQDR